MSLSFENNYIKRNIRMEMKMKMRVGQVGEGGTHRQKSGGWLAKELTRSSHWFDSATRVLLPNNFAAHFPNSPSFVLSLSLSLPRPTPFLSLKVLNTFYINLPQLWTIGNQPPLVLIILKDPNIQIFMLMTTAK